MSSTSTGGGGVPLTESLILQKTKLESLAAVKNLNLWGSEISELSILRRLPNLEILSLSVNCVASLKDIGECRNLKELYLRKNEVAALGEVQHLSRLPQLRTLWLCDNPCARHRLYRLYTIHCCPNLQQLDNGEVSDAERSQARALTQAQLHEAALAVDGGSAQPTPNASPTRVPAPAPAAGLPTSAGGAGNAMRPLGQQHAASTPLQAPQQRPPHQAPTTSSVAMPPAPQQPPPQRSSVSPGVVPPAAAAPGTSSRQVQKTIVSAVMTLMAELSPESLDFLRAHIDERLANTARK